MCGNKRKRLDLHEDIVEEILLKLPVKSLIRFKCVCKNWGARLQNPNFIGAHYRNQEIVDNAGASKFLLKRSHGETKYCFTSVDCRVDKEDEVNIKEKENIYLPFLGVQKRASWNYRRDSAPRVLGPCNGIVCLNDDIDTALWNPATREFRFLPASNVIRPPDTDVSFSFAIASGYVRKTDDYKVLRCVYNRERSSDIDEEIERAVFQFELYSLRTNQWREIQDRYCFGSAEHNLNMSIDGVYHNKYSYRGLISFDMADEVFTFTKFPKSWRSDGRTNFALAPFNNGPAIIRSGCNSVGVGKAILDVWVLKRIGAKESWTKELCIGLIPFATTLLGFWKDRVFVEVSNYEMAVFNLNSREMKDLGFRSRDSYQKQFINYVEALVSINGRSEQEVGIVRSLA